MFHNLLEIGNFASVLQLVFIPLHTSSLIPLCTSLTFVKFSVSYCNNSKLVPSPGILYHIYSKHLPFWLKKKKKKVFSYFSCLIFQSSDWCHFYLSSIWLLFFSCLLVPTFFSQIRLPVLFFFFFFFNWSIVSIQYYMLQVYNIVIYNF